MMCSMRLSPRESCVSRALNSNSHFPNTATHPSSSDGEPELRAASRDLSLRAGWALWRVAVSGSGAGGGALGRPARGPQTPEGVSMQGGDGSHGTPQAPIFSDFFGHFLLVFMGARRTCGHAITPCNILSALLPVPCCTIDHLHSSRGLSIKHSVTT